MAVCVLIRLVVQDWQVFLTVVRKDWREKCSGQLNHTAAIDEEGRSVSWGVAALYGVGGGVWRQLAKQWHRPPWGLQSWDENALSSRFALNYSRGRVKRTGSSRAVRVARERTTLFPAALSSALAKNSFNISSANLSVRYIDPVYLSIQPY